MTTPRASRLTDLQRAILDIYRTVADGTVVQVGRRYVEQQHEPPRIVLARATGSWGPPPKLNTYIAGVTFGMTAHIWGREPELTGDEPEDEIARHDDADDIAVRFINVLNRATGMARVEPGEVTDLSGIATHGEAYIFGMKFRAGVQRDKEIWRVEITRYVAGQENGPPDPMRPNGDTGKNIRVTTTVTPVSET